MKLLLFYHLHRQIEEIYYSALFFNRSEFLKNNCDVYVSCNNKNFSIKDLEQRCVFNAKTYISITNKNAGYSLGQVEAESDLFEMWKEYDYVIFCQPDVYIVSDLNLQEAFKMDFDALVAPINHIGRVCYCGDFFILKPKVNLFSEWKKFYDPNNDRNLVHEHYLADRINEHYSKILNVDRIGAQHHVIDNFGTWHEHNNNNVKKFLGI